MQSRFDAQIDRHGTKSTKYDYADYFGKPRDALPLWVADMDFAAPPAVAEAIRQRAAHGIFGYSDADEAYQNAVLGWFSARFGYVPSREALCLTPGVVNAICTAIGAFTAPGDAVLIQPPFTIRSRSPYCAPSARWLKTDWSTKTVPTASTSRTSSGRSSATA